MSDVDPSSVQGALTAMPRRAELARFRLWQAIDKWTLADCGGDRLVPVAELSDDARCTMHSRLVLPSGRRIGIQCRENPTDESMQRRYERELLEQEFLDVIYWVSRTDARYRGLELVFLLAHWERELMLDYHFRWMQKKFDWSVLSRISVTRRMIEDGKVFDRCWSSDRVLWRVAEKNAVLGPYTYEDRLHREEHGAFPVD